MISYPAGKSEKRLWVFLLNLRPFLCDYVENSIFNIFYKRATFGHFRCVFDVSPRLSARDCT